MLTHKYMAVMVMVNLLYLCGSDLFVVCAAVLFHRDDAVRPEKPEALSTSKLSLV